MALFYNLWDSMLLLICLSLCQYLHFENGCVVFDKKCHILELFTNRTVVSPMTHKVCHIKNIRFNIIIKPNIFNLIHSSVNIWRCVFVYINLKVFSNIWIIFVMLYNNVANLIPFSNPADAQNVSCLGICGRDICSKSYV